MLINRKITRMVLLTTAGLFCCAGCSRSSINYQIAESIGTLGKYDNNEPVETPQMQADREQKEAQQASEDELVGQLEAAQRLADGYYYDEAIEALGKITGEMSDDERISQAIEQYQADKDSLVPYEGDIAHLCFPGLIEDTMRAFDGDDLSYTYSSSMVTTDEWKAILQSLYDNGYILVDIHDIAGNETDERGVTTVEKKQLLLPSGKKPIILSQDNLNYSGIKNGDGIATKLTLDDAGNVKALLTDSNGRDLKGDYDFIPILDSYIEEHPDFSYRGAKGIVSVSGSEGVFGYQITDTAVSNNEENRKTVTEIAGALKASGWSIACAGYNHTYMNDMTLDALEKDITDWKTEVGSLVDETDILFYPYGGEVKYPSDQLDYLLDQGFVYLCGLWGDTDYMELGDGYMRQTRRFIDGYTLENAPQYFTPFFLAEEILDQDR